MIPTTVFILFDTATKCGHFFSPLNLIVQLQTS